MCEDLMKTKFKEYDKVANEFKKFFSQDELSIQIERKADKTQLSKVEKAKANKEQIVETVALVESLNERVKHMAILQNEVATSLEPIRNSFNHFSETSKKDIFKKVEGIQLQSKIIS